VIISHCKYVLLASYARAFISGSVMAHGVGPSVCLSRVGILTVTHQGAACDAASEQELHNCLFTTRHD